MIFNKTLSISIGVSVEPVVLNLPSTASPATFNYDNLQTPDSLGPNPTQESCLAITTTLDAETETRATSKETARIIPVAQVNDTFAELVKILARTCHLLKLEDLTEERNVWIQPNPHCVDFNEQRQNRMLHHVPGVSCSRRMSSRAHSGRLDSAIAAKKINQHLQGSQMRNPRDLVPT